MLHCSCHRKTCAFGLPVLQYLLYLPQNILNRVSEDGPLALVMAPTRELAIQIYGELQKLLSRQSQIKTCVVVGGQSIGQQAQQIREGVHIIVGTPGRINDCIEMAYLVLNQCCYIVLDEGWWFLYSYASLLMYRVTFIHITHTYFHPTRSLSLSISLLCA